MFTRERQRFAKVFHKKKGRDLQKYFSRKGRDLQKYFSRKGRDLQKYLSIQVFRRSIQIVSVVFKGIKKTCRFIISLYLEQNCNDISGDLNTVAFTAPLLLNSGPEKGRS